MIQSFHEEGGFEVGKNNLPRLITELKNLKLTGFIVPHEDEYQNEYIAEYAERLAWLTGFTGSAGMAVLLKNRAAIFVDGRYTLQAKIQVDRKLFSHEDLTNEGPAKWLEAHLEPGERIGYDPMLFTSDMASYLRSFIEKKNAKMIAVERNPIDYIWTDQPSIPKTPVYTHPIQYSGETHESKRHRIATSLQKLKADACILTDPESLAWLLNIRGNDIKYIPITLGYGVLLKTGALKLFIDKSKLSGSMEKDLGAEVEILPENSFFIFLETLKQKKVSIDTSKIPEKIYKALQTVKADLIRSRDPCSLPKSCKNITEIKGAKQAHIRDGVAVTRFLHWLKTEVQFGNYDEIQAVEKLEFLRKESEEFKDLSFDTISAFGGHGALAHYKVTHTSSSTLKPDSLYLVDSGAQYFDGTTDVTRTVIIGEPTQEMCKYYTLVLKAHIALACIRFPEGTTGHQLDSITRTPLWKAGLDYNHGTGHGVGTYLSVHEGPQRIGKPYNNIALQTGMILSNEPGYYRENQYGIRIENLQYITPPELIKGGEYPMLGFKSLTLVPLDRDLIDKSLLTPEEIDWVNNYHAGVLEKIAPYLDKTISLWVKDICQPL